jgi:phosphonate transport system ATP-binding protein
MTETPEPSRNGTENLHSSQNGSGVAQGDSSCSIPLFLANGVAKSYPGTRALAPLSFSIERGERIALAGPSGSGKTTLLHLLAGLIQPDEGQLFFHGRPLSQFKPGRELSSLVGLIEQQYSLVPHLPVIQNVLAGRLGQWSLFRSIVSLVCPQERHLAEAALGQVGIADKVKERTFHLSGGEQQRVAIARLMVQSPRVILADEPVASLDPARAEDLVRLLSNLATASSKTLIASLHSPYLIRKYFSRVIGLRDGHLQFDLPAPELTEPVLAGLYNLKPGGASEVGEIRASGR